MVSVALSRRVLANNADNYHWDKNQDACQALDTGKAAKRLFSRRTFILSADKRAVILARQACELLWV